MQNVSLQVHFTLCIAVDNYWSYELVMSREVLVEANRRIVDSNIVPTSMVPLLQQHVAVATHSGYSARAGHPSSAVTTVAIISAPQPSPSYVVF